MKSIATEEISHTRIQCALVDARLPHIRAIRQEADFSIRIRCSAEIARLQILSLMFKKRNMYFKHFRSIEQLNI